MHTGGFSSLCRAWMRLRKLESSNDTWWWTESMTEPIYWMQLPWNVSPIEIASIAIAGTLLITSINFGIKSIQSMLRSQSHRSLKYLFILSIFALCCYLIACILISAICQIPTGNNDRRAMIPFTFAILSYYIMILNLLGSLLFRLYITFSYSPYSSSFSFIPEVLIAYAFIFFFFINLVIFRQHTHKGSTN